MADGYKLLEAAKTRNFKSISKILSICNDNHPKLLFQLVNFQHPISDNTALHDLFSGCFCNDCFTPIKKSMEILLENKADPNIENGENATPLDMLVKKMAPVELAKILIGAGAGIVKSGTDNLKSGKTATTDQGPSEGIQSQKRARKMLKKRPEFMLPLLDKAVSFEEKPKPNDPEKNQLCVTIDWRYVVYQKDACSDPVKWYETTFLRDIIHYASPEKMYDVLGHPVIESFLTLKSPLYWKHFGIFYSFWILSIFIAYMFYTWYLYSVHCDYDFGGNSTTIENIDRAFNEEKKCVLEPGMTVAAYIITILFLVGPVTVEVLKIRSGNLRIWTKNWSNFVFIPSLIFTMVTLWPALTLKHNYRLSWQYPSASLGMLVGSLSILVQLTPLPTIAIYIEMLFKVLIRLMKAVLALMPLFLGFFFAFRVLLAQRDVTWFKLLTLIVSDSDFEDFKDEGRGTFYDAVAYFLFASFVIVLVVVMMNFLTGFAVDDIRALRLTAQGVTYFNQVRAFHMMDSVISWKSSSVTGRGDRDMMQLSFPMYNKKKDSRIFSELIGWWTSSLDDDLSLDLRLRLLDIARRNGHSHADQVSEKFCTSNGSNFECEESIFGNDSTA